MIFVMYVLKEKQSGDAPLVRWPKAPREKPDPTLRIGGSIPTADAVRGTFGKALSINRPTRGSAPHKKG